MNDTQIMAEGYLAAKEQMAATDMRRIIGLIEKAQAMKGAIEAFEENLNEIKDDHRQLIEETLPQAMQEVGMDTFGAPELGVDVELENKVDCKIPQKFESEAFNWLKDNGHGDIIKNEIVVSFGAGEEEKAEEVYSQLNGLPASRKMNVHSSTLKAFVKSMLEDGKELPLEYFGVFQRTVAKIKPRKT